MDAEATLRWLGPLEASAWAVADPPTARGFALAGFRAAACESPEAAGHAIAAARAAGAVLVVVSEDLAERAGGLPEPARRGAEPLLLALPSALRARASPGAEARLARAVRRALGLAAGSRGGAA